MKTILHLTCDFPDPLVGAKTRCVVSLIDNTPGFRHVVYSLNRANWRSNIVALPFGPDRTAVAYGAPPKGLMLETRLLALSRWIERDLAARNIAPDLVHAHKLTVEGLIAHDLFRRRGIPYVASIWGDTDLKFLAMRRDLRPRWQEVMAKAARLLPIAPWTAERFIADFALDRGKVETLLPIVNHETSHPSTLAEQPRFATLFNLDVHRRKNLRGLIAALAEVRRDDDRVTLDIWGAGGAETLCDIEAMIDKAGARGFVRLMGRFDWSPEAVRRLNGYTAFVLPTSRESFGMVFVEALFCGLPVLYTRGWSIDGLYPAERIGYAWDGKSNEDIARGLRHLIANEKTIKASIDELARGGALDQLKRQAIIARYTGILETATGPAAPAPDRAPA
jgi:glycosyltransferase involved in cell wall biosynthesis